MATVDAAEKQKIAKTIFRQGEIKLNSQLAMSIAADQRGSVLAGIFSAVTTALSGWAGYLISTQSSNWALVSGLITSAIVFLIASGFCVYAVRPTRLYTAGSKPTNWTSDGALDKGLTECYLKESINYDKYIVENREQMRENTLYISRGMGAAAASPIAGVIIYIIVSGLSWR